MDTPAVQTVLKLFLVRHGETAWSLSGRHTGAADIALTQNGEAQARALAPWLSREDFTRVLTSPRQRARRTCELAGLAAGAEIEPDLAEWDYGHYEGQRSVDIRKTGPDWILFRDGCPGGESPGDIRDRADRLIRRLLTMTGNIALFAHGQFGSALAARWIGLPVVEGQHLSLDTASLSLMTFSPAHPDVPVLALWNAVPGRLREETEAP